MHKLATLQFPAAFLCYETPNRPHGSCGRLYIGRASHKGRVGEMTGRRNGLQSKSILPQPPKGQIHMCSTQQAAVLFTVAHEPTKGTQS